jgi:hypothetical protein
MAEITLKTGESGPTLSLNDIEQSMLDEFSIKPAGPKQPSLVRPKPKPKVAFDPGMDAFINPNKRIEEDTGGPPMVTQGGGWMGGEEDEDEEQPQGYAGPTQAEPSPGYRTVEDEKADLLNKLERLKKKGVALSKKFSIYSDLEELRTEYKRITYSIEADQSIRFQRRMLMACVTGLEFLNKRYDPFDVHLDGWSESMMENIDDYDSVFEDLYVKYKDKVAVAPEIRLIMMVGGSAMMFHLSSSMFKAAIPNVGQILKKNPDLVKNMMEAVQASTAPPQSSRPSPGGGGPREMRGPGFDITSLLGGFQPPPPPVMRPPPPPPALSTTDAADDISDIVSVSDVTGDGDSKDISIGKPKRGRKKKNEVVL